MKSSFPALQSRLPTLLAGVVLFFLIAVWSAALLHQNDAPFDMDIVFSPPARLTPGDTAEIALYAFKRNSTELVKELKFEANLRLADRPAPVTPPCSAVEKRPGLYTVKLPVPDSLNDGSYELVIFKTGFLKRSLAIFPVQVGKNFSIVAVPPELPVRAGDSSGFKLAAIDTVTSRSLPRIPIRCRITTPDGFQTTNRVVFTSQQGTGSFNFSLHPNSPAGEYLFEFSCGHRSIVFRLPVRQALPPLAYVREKLLQTVENLPTPLAVLIYGGGSKSDISEKWGLHQGKQAHSAIRWAKAGTNAVHVNFAFPESPFGTIEIWQRNRLLRSAICTRTSGTAEITFKNKLSLTAPIKVRLWRKNRRQIWSDEYIIPSASGPETSLYRFRQLAEKCWTSPGKVLARLLAPPPVSVQVSGSLQRSDRLAFLTELFAEACLLCLPWVLFIGLSLPLFGKLCSDEGNSNCKVAATFLVPVSTAMATFFLLILRSDLAAPPAPIILFTLFIVADLVERVNRAGTMQTDGNRLQNPKAQAGLPSAARQAVRAFIYLGQLLSGLLFLHMAAGGLTTQASQNLILLIITVTAALLTLTFLARTGLLNLNGHRNAVLSPISASIQKFTLGLSKGGWKAAVFLTMFLAALFLGILRFHSFVSPSVSSTGRQESRRIWGQKNTDVHLPSALQFSLEKQDSATSDSRESAIGIFPTDSQRFFQSRFIILNGTRIWTGRRIKKILVFTRARDFFNRWIAALSTLRPNLWTVSLEINSRAARLRHLEPSARPPEQERLEACLTVFGNMLARELQSGKTHTPIQHGLLLETLANLSKAVSTDPAFQHAVQALPVVPMTGDDHDPFAALLERGSATSSLRILDIIAPALRAGGALHIGGDDGTSLSFPIGQDMTTLTRGTSFRETLDISKLESVRETPLLLELSFMP